MKERTKDMWTGGFLVLIGIGLGAMGFALFGCGGPGWLGTGLLIENLLDPDETGADGLDCFDLNANGECDEEEDANGDGFCDALDCRGEDGGEGPPGDPGVPGPEGPVGPPGPVSRPAPVIIVIDDSPDEDPPADNTPPFGNGHGRGPGNHPEHP